MRKFADLHVKLPDMSDEFLKRLGQLAKDMGLSLLGVVVSQSIDQSQVNRIRNVFSAIGVDVAFRVDLYPRSREQLLKDLRRVRKRFEIVAVECRSPRVATVAFRDRRVDIVSFPVKNRMKFSRSIARLHRGSLEIDVAQLVSTGELTRHFVLSRLRNEVSTAKTNHVPIVLSSGADNLFVLRAPREVAALGTLLGLEVAEALDSVSLIPLAIIEQNRAKLSPEYITVGVKLAKVKSNA